MVFGAEAGGYHAWVRWGGGDAGACQAAGQYLPAIEGASVMACPCLTAVG
jgi:hypothetical protein